MKHEPLLTVEEFNSERQKADESTWSDVEIFEEARTDAPLRELVVDNVQMQYELSAVDVRGNSAREFAREEALLEGMLPDDLPESVRNSFSEDFAEEFEKQTQKLYDLAKEEISFDDDAAEPKEIQNMLERIAAEEIPETF